MRFWIAFWVFGDSEIAEKKEHRIMRPYAANRIRNICSIGVLKLYMVTLLHFVSVMYGNIVSVWDIGESQLWRRHVSTYLQVSKRMPNLLSNSSYILVTEFQISNFLTFSLFPDVFVCCVCSGIWSRVPMWWWVSGVQWKM